MFLRQIFDPHLAQYAYLVGCQKTGEAIVIDPERDIDRYRAVAAGAGLRITAVAETHIHADFVSGAQEFAASDPALKVYVSGEGGPPWESVWAKGYEGLVTLRDDDTFRVGKIEFTAVHTPGHTPEHVSYLVTDIGGGADEPMAAFTGDFIFVGDVGRPDLLEQAAGVVGAQEPAARQLFASLRKFARYDGPLQILPAHGAGSACGKALGAVPSSTLSYERKFNGALRLALTGSEEEFVKFILAGQPEPPLYFARMKQVNRDGIGITSGVPQPQKIDAARAKTWRGRVLDTRGDRAAFAGGHLPGALHAPIPGPFFSTAAGSYLAPEDEVLLVVEKESSVDDAARQLYRMGFDRLGGWVLAADLAAAGLLTAHTERIEFQDWDQAALDGGLVLDVRNASEFAGGHLDGALNIAYTRLKARLTEVPRGRRLFVHCGSGKRAALAAAFLLAEGFDVVHVDGTCSDCDRIAETHSLTH